VGLAPRGEVIYTNVAFREILGMQPVAESRLEDVPSTYRVFDRNGHLLDLMMAGTTGMDLADLLEARAPDRLARTVFMTGGAFTPRAADFVSAHSDRCVEKPFDVVAETRRRLA